MSAAVWRGATAIFLPQRTQGVGSQGRVIVGGSDAIPAILPETRVRRACAEDMARTSGILRVLRANLRVRCGKELGFAAARGLLLSLGLSLILAAPGEAQLLDHSLAVENQFLVLQNFPGPEAGDLAQNGVIDGLYMSGGLVWGLGNSIELHLDADLGAIYDDDAGDTAIRATVHRAYLEGSTGETID